MDWEISGESGKQFGPDRRAASEVAVDVSLSLESLQPDRVSWSVSGALADLSDLALPELGEEVTLWRSGVRKFRGICTARPASISASDVAVNVSIEGAHWWLEKTPLTEPRTDAEGTTQERAEIVFLKGDLRGHFARLFTLAKSAGLRVELGTIADLYEVPQTTLTEGSFADALAELVRLVPDALTWWDYSGETPAFNLSRRGSAEVLELEYGGGLLESATFSPRLGLETEEVVVQYSERGNDGEVRFREQRAGSPALGKRQVVITSGDALTDILPPDPIESETITADEIVISSGSTDKPTALLVWQFYQDWLDRFPSQVSNVTEFLWVGSDPDSQRYNEGVAPKVFEEDGTQVSGSSTDYRYVIIDPLETPPDWLVEQLGLVKVKLQGTIFLEVDTTAVSTYPEWVNYLLQGADYQDSVLSGGNITFYLFYDLDIELWAMTEASPPTTATTYYQPLGYQFLSPPPGFAANLRQAQGFLPYEGQASLVEAVAGGVAPLGKVLNVTGALDEWRTMRALVQGLDLNLADGRQTIRCGAPQRLSFQDIVNRLRTSSRDNVDL